MSTQSNDENNKHLAFFEEYIDEYYQECPLSYEPIADQTLSRYIHYNKDDIQFKNKSKSERNKAPNNNSESNNDGNGRSSVAGFRLKINGANVANDSNSATPNDKSSNSITPNDKSSNIITPNDKSSNSSISNDQNNIITLNDNISNITVNDMSNINTSNNKSVKIKSVNEESPNNTLNNKIVNIDGNNDISGNNSENEEKVTTIEVSPTAGSIAGTNSIPPDLNLSPIVSLSANLGSPVLPALNNNSSNGSNASTNATSFSAQLLNVKKYDPSNRNNRLQRQKNLGLRGDTKNE